jgi:hypothetical protein
MEKDRGAINKKPPGSGEMPHFQGLRLPGTDFFAGNGILRTNDKGPGQLILFSSLAPFLF